MKLVALKDVDSSIATIPAGSDFHELDDERAQQLIDSGHARKWVPATAAVAPAMAPAAPAAPAAAPPAAPAAPAAPVAVRGISLHWPGATVAIVASGPSLTQEQCDALQAWRHVPNTDRRVIAINTSYRRAPFADILYACDARWWTMPQKEGTYYQQATRHFKNEQMWTQDKDTAMKLHINFIRSEVKPGLSKKSDVVNQGYSSTHQAIGLAVLAGATNILLFGVDMKGGHWHGDHPPGLNAALPFSTWKKEFAALAPDLKAAGVKVVNCSPDTALTVFPREDWKKALES